MKAVKLKIEGTFNSFRIPDYKSYHRTFLAPPKTTIVGMLSNIQGKSEELFYRSLNENFFTVSVVVNNLKGIFKDLWVHKLFGKNQGRSILRRDHLFYASYYLYICPKDENLVDEIFNNLNFTKKIPSLGQDDQVIKFTDISKIDLSKVSKKEIDSVFVYEKDRDFQYRLNNDNDFTMLPQKHRQPLKFKVEYKNDSRTIREPYNYKNFVESLNCKINFLENQSLFTDGKYIIDLY